MCVFSSLPSFDFQQLGRVSRVYFIASSDWRFCFHWFRILIKHRHRWSDNARIGSDKDKRVTLAYIKVGRNDDTVFQQRCKKSWYTRIRNHRQKSGYFVKCLDDVELSSPVDKYLIITFSPPSLIPFHPFRVTLLQFYFSSRLLARYLSLSGLFLLNSRAFLHSHSLDYNHKT